LVLVLYGFQAWSLTLKKENITRVLENRVLRNILGHTRVEVTGGGDCIMRSFVICADH
jgi:hypothetical protein